MPFPRKRDALQFTEPELRKLDSIRKSRTEEKRRTVRAALLLDSLSGQSDETIARHHCVSRGTVVLCIRKCLQFGLDAALGELPPDRQAAATAGRRDCLGAELCLPEAQGTRLFLRTVDLQAADRPSPPALRRRGASGPAKAEPLQTP